MPRRLTPAFVANAFRLACRSALTTRSSLPGRNGSPACEGLFVTVFALRATAKMRELRRVFGNVLASAVRGGAHAAEIGEADLPYAAECHEPRRRQLERVLCLLTRRRCDIDNEFVAASSKIECGPPRSERPSLKPTKDRISRRPSNRIPDFSLELPARTGSADPIKDEITWMVASVSLPISLTDRPQRPDVPSTNRPRETPSAQPG
jgi:hypothetical protein